MSDLDERYVEFSKTLSELVDIEASVHNKKRLLADLQEEIGTGDGGHGLELTAHAFQQISVRLEDLAFESPVIYSDVYKSNRCLLSPSNLKSFVMTMLANARANGDFTDEASKSSNGYEYRYTVHMKKWSNAKALKFIAIVENNKIKSGWFNWT